MRISEAYPSKYLKAADLAGQDRTVTIRACVQEELGPGSEMEVKPVLYFDGGQKGLVLNKTNATVEIEHGLDVQFCVLGITERQIVQMGLPTRKPKRKSAVDKIWEYDFACELDAMPPDVMRSLVERDIQIHLPANQLAVLKVAEASEREMLKIFSTQFGEEARP